MMQLTYGHPLTEFTDRFERETMPAIIANETRYEAYGLEDADVVITAYGTAARMAKAAVKELQTDLKFGFIRPMTAWPFPGSPTRRSGATARRSSARRSTPSGR